MSEWIWGFGTASAIAAFVAWTIRTAYRPESQPQSTEYDKSGNITIHPLAREEFSRLLARALLHEHGNNVLIPMLAASGKNWTPREALMIRYMLGEISKADFVQGVDDMTTLRPSYHDPLILIQQLEIMRNVLGRSS